MTWLLVALTVYTADRKPVRGAWVEVEGMYKTEFYEEQVTDSRRRYVVQVEPGPHRCMITKAGFVPVESTLEFNGADLTIHRISATADRETSW